MKRWLLRILVFLILGAIVNVAVAWTISVTYDQKSAAVVALAPAPVYWLSRWPNEIVRSELELILVTGTGWREGFASNDKFMVWFTGAGWPRLALSGSLWEQIDERAFLTESTDGLWRTPGKAMMSGIPYRPIWPGFAINTVFYAFVLWLLFAGPFVLRRRRRIHRGLCPKCAYDLRGTPKATACPECGAQRVE